MNTYYVYILATKLNKLLYIGVTNNLSRRLYEHKNMLIDGFTKKYHIDKLVYYEEYSTIKKAIVREKQLKGWTRAKKNVLILEHNPLMKDLSENRIE